MSPDLLFAVFNNSILAGWFLLVFFPRWKWGSQLICPLAIPGLLGIAYVVVLISQWGRVEGSFTSLQGVETLFANRYALLGGWIHYLAFDLFIGSWEVRDSQSLGISHGFVVPCLVLTLLFGPAGLLLYCVLRTTVRRNAFVSNT